MIRRTRREWEYLPVDDPADAESISRAVADGLLAAARAAGLGGPDGERVLVDGRRRLRTQQVVGVIAAPEATLEILPKIDGLDAGATRENLVRMLADVYDLRIASGELAELGCQRDDLLEILIRLFCERLFVAVHRGLPRRYVTQSGDLPALRGRLDAPRQFRALAATPQRLACRYDELSPDIALNQIMKAAVRRLTRISRAPANQRRLAELDLALADVAAVPVAELAWREVVLDRTNAHWAALLSLARLLLGDRFQTTSLGSTSGFSLLFDMSTLFEEYIGRTLRRSLTGCGVDVRLQGPRDHALVGEDGVRRFATRPDIVVSARGHPLLIIDTKWKRLVGALDDAKLGVGQGDVYQLMAYAQVYRCDRLLLLYPHHEGLGPRDGLMSTHQVRGAEHVRLGVSSVRLGILAEVGSRLRALVAGQLGEGAQGFAA